MIRLYDKDFFLEKRDIFSVNLPNNFITEIKFISVKSFVN